VARRYVLSRNLEHEEAKARYRAVKIQPQWVVTPGKQTVVVVVVVLARCSPSTIICPAGQVAGIRRWWCWSCFVSQCQKYHSTLSPNTATVAIHKHAATYQVQQSGPEQG
jgi:hypothetical protein